MIESIIRFSVHQKLIVGFLVLGLMVAGIFSLSRLSIDAVPDITNNQVQVVTISPSLAPQEMEQFITYPVEVAMANIPKVTEIRSVSRFGLSVVTIVFEDEVPILDARQFVKEQIGMAEQEIPSGLGKPELMPITTGLGEIYQYVLTVQEGYEHRYDAMELRTIQDWIVKRQLAGISGIIEVSSFGGYLKQYEVALDPVLLQSYDISIQEVFEALARNNQNSGGSYIEKATNAFYIRTEGVVSVLEDIEQIVIGNHQGTPVLIRHVGKVGFGSPKRFGAMTMDGKGEAVGGITLMFKGANSSEAIQNVHERIEQVRRSLPEGVELYPYLDRSVLVAKTISTVSHNLIEGGIIVILVLILLLGNWRAGFIVASIIPLAMLFAIILMNYFGVSANLMSLGAIDFGIVVDGAVIIVEGVLHALAIKYVGQRLDQTSMDGVIIEASSKLFRSSVFGVFIILVVFVPIMTLTGIEGKMFRPMAMTFSFAVLGALILSLTYVPMMAALMLSKKISDRPTVSDRIMNFFKWLYLPVLKLALRLRWLVLGATLAVFMLAYVVFRQMGAEFIPTLEEGDLAMQMTIQPGSSLQESIRTSTKAEKVLLSQFPEVRHVVSKIGTAEVPTDPMAVEDADIMIILKEKEDWTSASTREELVEKMKMALEVVAGASFEFTQPIQLRFNELMTGAKTDIAVQIFGENTETLKELGDRAAGLIAGIAGAGDVKVEQTEGLPQLVVQFNRRKIAEYGINIEDLNTLVRTAYAGEVAGVVFENERKFDLVVRLGAEHRDELDLNRLYAHLDDGRVIPLGEVAQAKYQEGPMQISREDARRRINIGVNVRNRDVASLVADIQQTLGERLLLPPGYSIKYGGQFENLEKATRRLSIAVPIALAMIFILLFFTFGKLKYALMIFTAVPMSAVGGIIALYLRNMPFSISAGVGFIALFGVAVLNGIVLISHFNRLRYEDGLTVLEEVILKGSIDRLRPVLMTATVAALGFLPMALSNSNGAEVQKPLATVVIGGLVTATLLTLVLLPVLYYLVNRRIMPPPPAATLLPLLMVASLLLSQGNLQAQGVELPLDSALQMAVQRHPALQNAGLQVQIAELGRQEARQLPLTDFNLQAGQINTTLLDLNFSAVQPLGNPAARKSRQSLAEAGIARSIAERTLLGRRLDLEVRRAWYTWNWRSARRRRLEEQLELFRQFDERAQVQYQTGETSGLDRSLAAAQLVRAREALGEARREERIAYTQLLQTGYLVGDFVAPEALPEPIPLPVSAELSQALTAPWEQEVELARRQTVLNQKALAPEWSVGYFYQSIRPDWFLQGIHLGLSLPIFSQSQRARIEQSRLQERIAGNELEWQRRQLSRQRQTAWEQISDLRRRLDEQGAQLLQQAGEIRRLAGEQLAQGEIDFFRFAQSLDIARSSELDYLDLLEQYNQAVLEYNFLTGF